MFSAWVALVSGLFFLTMGFLTTAKGSAQLLSVVLFKVIPVILGLALIVSSLLLFGFVVVK